ncbi:hypothetical protein U8527_04110 [Kordia algicida OT-1]|uniref:hypothetical protein n=1 Tax=Kordia algicida TaxID=221066 RepID=UPI003D9BBD39
MSEKNITALIGKAIREGKYLSISYKNKNGDKKRFWIAILDINAKGELFVNMFNVTKDEPILDAKIFISGILSAEILKFSHYNVSDELIIKLDEDSSLEKYEFDKFDNNVLNYYLECYKANSDPFLFKKYLIQELEVKELIEENHISYQTYSMNKF